MLDFSGGVRRRLVHFAAVQLVAPRVRTAQHFRYDDEGPVVDEYARIDNHTMRLPTEVGLLAEAGRLSGHVGVACVERSRAHGPAIQRGRDPVGYRPAPRRRQGFHSLFGFMGLSERRDHTGWHDETASSGYVLWLGRRRAGRCEVPFPLAALAAAP